jgi:hypothetical protein
MPIVVNQNFITTPSSDSTTLVSDILNCVSQDVRGVIQTTGGDAVILTDYTNRISLDVLRYSRWKFLESGVLQFPTVVGVTDYWIGALGGGANDTGLNLTDIQSIKRDSVFNRTVNSPQNRLFKTDEAPLGAEFSQNSLPKLWRNDVSTPSVLNIYPPADQVYTIEFRYFKVRKALTNVTQTLQIPDAYKDVVCAGVNMLTFKYLQKDEDMQFWMQTYQAGKQSIIRDKNLFPADGDFVRPDPTSIISTNNTGLGLDASVQYSIP